MIILVTGGTGFIGSNLCYELVKDKNNHVICLDNNFTGNLDNIRKLRKMDNFEFVRHDVCKSHGTCATTCKTMSCCLMFVRRVLDEMTSTEGLGYTTTTCNFSN